jgi:hypothetical protein
MKRKEANMTFYDVLLSWIAVPVVLSRGAAGNEKGGV